MTNSLLSDPNATDGNYRIDFICEQVDEANEVVRDLTPWFITDGSQIERNSCATQDALTARLNFAFTREDIREVFDAETIPWQRMRLKVSMIVGDTDPIALGVMLPETPKLMADQTPNVFAVDCHDVIHGLAEPTNGTLGIAGGTPIGLAIDSLFNLETIAGSPSAKPLQLNRDFSLISIATLVRSDRQWVIDESTTWLLVIDQLLESAGWLPPWTNRDGTLTSQAWVSPINAPAELILDDDARTTVIQLGATTKLDTYGVPNKFTYISTDFNPDETQTPVVGNGITVRDNLSVGPSSQEARGRIIASVVRIDAADQQSLEDFADRDFLASITPAKTLCLNIAPQPIPWHRGIVDVTISDLDIIDQKYMIRNWTIPLDGADCYVVLDGIDALTN